MNGFMLRAQIRPAKIIEVDDLSLGIRLARQGLGIALTSGLAVSEELKNNTLCPVRLEDGKRHSWEINAIYHSDRGLSYAGWEMLKILEKMSGLVLR
jgi:DNA-binding transcriptional LysR family regulator